MSVCHPDKWVGHYRSEPGRHDKSLGATFVQVVIEFALRRLRGYGEQLGLPWGRVAVDRVDKALPPYAPEEWQVGVEKEAPGESGNIAITAERFVILLVVGKVSFPQKRAVELAAHNRL